MEGKRIGDYVFHEYIGAGSSSEVWVCVHVRTNRVVACKVIDLLSMMQDSFYYHFMNEIKIHSSIRHPCITEILDIAMDNERIYLFMEYCSNGDLNIVVHNEGGLSEDQAKIYFAQIMSALSYIHRHNIAHRDIKLENIAITEDGYAKLTDFGLSRLQNDSPMFSQCGTLAYVAPEIIKEQPYGLPVDIWSAAVLLYAMVAFHFPWTSEDGAEDRINDEVSRQILEGNVDFPEEFSAELVNLLQFMFAENPDDRPTAEQILGHAWLSGISEAIPSVDMEANQGLVQLVDSALAEIGKLRQERLGHL